MPSRRNQRRVNLSEDELAFVRQQYREILQWHDLTDEQIDAIRVHVRLLAETLAEHVFNRDAFGDRGHSSA